MKKIVSKLTAALLAIAMAVPTTAVIPAFAAVTSARFEKASLDIVSEKNATLAPGITQDSYTVYDKKGAQVKMFVTTADMSVDTVSLFASYKDMDPTKYDMSKLTEQVAAFEKKAASGDEYYQGTVVAGINASYYNMTTGQPTGAFVMNGIDMTTESAGNAYGYFAVMKDGSVKIGKPGDYSNDKQNIQEAIGIYTMLIVDGEICKGLDDVVKYPRQTIGITADGKVVLMTADGNQAPTTVGLTVQEQAEVMLDLGCVWAGHLDGGGSCTYASRQEGTDSFTITNSPSDGSERSISNGFIIVSTEVSDGKFSTASLTAEYSYVTPYSTVAVSAIGLDKAGGHAEIPDDVTWKVSDESMGTVSNGVFTGSSKTGEAVVQLCYDGKVVGETVINVVLPDKLSFLTNDITVPYGKTVSLNLSAFYGVKDVLIKDTDIKFVFSDSSIGEISGFNFIASEEGEGANSSSLVATLVYDSSVKTEAKITLGKASELINDFGNIDISKLSIKTAYPHYGPSGSKLDPNGNYYYNGQNELGKISIVTDANGKVHSGKYALAVECDFTQPYETGYHALRVSGLNYYVPANAQAIGMWIYFPELEELSTTSMELKGKTESKKDVNLKMLVNCEVYGWDNDGWHFVSVDVSKFTEAMTLTTQDFYICDRDNSSNGFYFKEHASVNSKHTYYIDDVIIDYSGAVEDREAPVFSDVTYATTNMADAVSLNGQTVTMDAINFNASVKDDTTKSNYTGIAAETAKAYIDGNEVTCSYNNGIISTDAILSDGVHTVRFEITDNNGNSSYIVRQITVAAGTDRPTVSIIPRDSSADKILIGSLYWVDIVSSDLEEIKNAEVVFNLNSVSQWELDNMEVAYGFDATYTIDSVTNNATIVFTANDDEQVVSGETVLAQVPIRTWESRLTEYEGYENQTPEKLWERKIIWPMDIKLSTYKGSVEFKDGTKGSFSMKPVEVITELYGNYSELNANGDYANKSRWHKHTESNLPDEAATCTKDGYTGRTYCEVCKSVVEWGERTKATGHKYDFVDGVLKCTNTACGQLFTGTYSDGKDYVDGVLTSDGWVGDSYYKDGVKLTGIQFVDGYYYDFGDDGVCANQIKYTGLLYDETVSAWKYSKLGELTGGWVQIGENWHYFKSYTKVAATGAYTIDGVTYQFDETGMTEGAWHTNVEGIRYYYGPSYYVARDSGYMTLIEINGKTYNFDNDGYLTTGIQVLRDSTSFKKYMFDFGEDGALIRRISEEGMAKDTEGNSYYINSEGYIAMNAGIIKYQDNYYYVVYSGKLKQDGYQTVTNVKANGLIEPGTYYFDNECKIQGLKDNTTGIVWDVTDSRYVYKVNGTIQKNLGLIEVEGNYYYVCYSGKLKQSSYQSVTESTSNGLIEPGIYYFSDDCKMVIPEKPDTTTGIVWDDTDGRYVYKVNGIVQKNLGLIEVEGSYYYVCYSGKLKQSSYQTVSESTSNGLIEPGAYYFSDDCKMVILEKPDTTTGIVWDATDSRYVYKVNGIVQKNLGLIEVEGSYYYVCYSGKLKQSSYQTVTESNSNGLIEPGTYYFGDDCKMSK